MNPWHGIKERTVSQNLLIDTLLIDTELNSKLLEKNSSLIYQTVLSHIYIYDFSVPPSIVDPDTSSDTSVDERQKLSLRCRASGYPPPTVTWRREDSKDLNLGLYGGKKYSGE